MRITWVRSTWKQERCRHMVQERCRHMVTGRMALHDNFILASTHTSFTLTLNKSLLQADRKQLQQHLQADRKRPQHPQLEGASGGLLQSVSSTVGCGTQVLLPPTKNASTLVRNSATVYTI
jgi:hypothetical protein